MTTAEKLETIAENELKVYEAGKREEHNKFWDNYQENGNRVSYAQAFCKLGWNDENFKPKYNMTPTNADTMFSESRITDLAGILKKQGVTIDTSKSTTVRMMYYWCTRITTIPTVDTTNVTDNAAGLYYLFGSDGVVKSIEKLVLKNDGSQVISTAFSGCYELEELRIEGVIGQNVNLQQSKKLTHDSLMSVVNALQDKTGDTSGTGWTLSIGSDNYTKLTESEIEIARNKGWEVV